MALVALVLLVAQLALFGCASQGSTGQGFAEGSATEVSEEQVEQGEPAEDAQASEQASLEEYPASVDVDYHKPGDGYTLEQVVVLSRHNIRSPLSTNGSALDTLTPHTWYPWTSAGSELSLRGGVLECEMGQYFRRWLEDAELIPQNWQPTADEARFYANAKQRTIATTHYFSAGMLPVADVEIETNAPYDTMDPVFSPQLTFASDSYVDAALDEIAHANGASGMDAVAAEAADSYKLISEICDTVESDAAKSGEFTGLDTTDTGVAIEDGQEPKALGSLKTACQLSDALVLQYYEESDPVRAAFGHELSFDDWKCVSKSKDLFIDLLYGQPLMATNLAHPLLQEIGSELKASGRTFSFLCGHDSNIASVLGALDAEPYELEGSIEAGTPIGGKVVFERWADAQGEEYGRVRLIYANAEQLRSATLLVGDNQPMAYELSFEGLEKNADGLYAYKDLEGRIQSATDAYDEIVSTYQDQAEAA